MLYVAETILTILETNKNKKIPLFIIVLCPKIHLKYLSVFTFLNSIGCELIRSGGVWCIESNDAELNKLKKFILSLKYNNK